MTATLTRGQRVTVRALAPDGAPSWAFAAEALTDDGVAIVLRVAEGEPIEGPEPWNWPAPGDLHLWRNRPYGILVTTRSAPLRLLVLPRSTPPSR